VAARIRSTETMVDGLTPLRTRPQQGGEGETRPQRSYKGVGCTGTGVGRLRG